MNEFVKNDKGKLQWSLMPFEQLEDVVRVLMAGANKYGTNNWKKCDDVKRYKDALMRHVVSYCKGEALDCEDSLPHLAHAICNCLFLQWFDNNGISTKTAFEQYEEILNDKKKMKQKKLLHQNVIMEFR